MIEFSPLAVSQSSAGDDGWSNNHLTKGCVELKELIMDWIIALYYRLFKKKKFITELKIDGLEWIGKPVSIEVQLEENKAFVQEFNEAWYQEEMEDTLKQFKQILGASSLPTQ